MGAPNSAPYAPYDRLLENFVLLQRTLLLIPVTAFAAAPGVVTSGGGGAAVPFVVAPNQALRIVKNSWGRCRANLALDKDLTCESLSMQVLANTSNQPIQIWSGFYSGDKLGFAGGAIVTTDGDDVLFGRDALALTAPTQPFFFQCLADVFNNGAGAENFRLDGSLLLELWQVSTVSRMRG